MDLTNQEKQVEDLMRECLERRFALYNLSHLVMVRSLGDERMYVGYRTNTSFRFENTTHFSLNIDGDILYRLSIGIYPAMRGIGYGLMLGQTTEEFGRLVGCRVLRTTASGKTVTGEPKYIAYQRRGFKPINDVELEKIL